MKMKLTLGASPSAAASSKSLRLSSGRTTSPSMHTTMASSCVSCVPPTRIFFSPRHDCSARKSVTFLCSSTLCVKNASRVLGSLGGRLCFLANSFLAASILGLSAMSSPHATAKRAARVARRPATAKKRRLACAQRVTQGFVRGDGRVPWRRVCAVARRGLLQLPSCLLHIGQHHRHTAMPRVASRPRPGRADAAALRPAVLRDDFLVGSGVKPRRHHRAGVVHGS